MPNNSSSWFSTFLIICEIFRDLSFGENEESCKNFQSKTIFTALIDWRHKNISQTDFSTDLLKEEIDGKFS